MKKDEKDKLKMQVMECLRANQTVNKQDVMIELLGAAFTAEYITAILVFNDARNELALEGIDYRPLLNGNYTRSDIKQTLHRASKDRKAAINKLTRSKGKLSGINTDGLDPHTKQVVKRSQEKTLSMATVVTSLKNKKNFSNVEEAVKTIKRPLKPQRVKKEANV